MATGITKDGRAAAGRIAEFRQSINSGMTTPEARASIRQPNKPPVINSEIVGNTEPLNLPVTGKMRDAQNKLSAAVDAPPAPDKAAPEEKANPREQIMTAILGNIEKMGTKSERTGEINEEEGVFAKKQQLDDIQNRIERANFSYNERATRIEERGGGLAMGMNAELNNLERERSRYMANLRIEESSANRSYETAFAIAKAKVDAEFEPLKEMNEAYGQVYNMMLNDLSESEKLQVQQKYTERNNNTKLAQDTAEQITNELITAGAYTADKAQAINAAVDEAQKLINEGQSPAAAVQKMRDTLQGVQTLGQLQMEAQRANIAQSWASVASSNTSRLLALAEAGDPKAIGKLGFDPRDVKEELDPTTKRALEEQKTSNESLLGLAGRYKQIIDDYGFTNQVAGDSALLGEISSLRGLMTAEYKRAETLGSLDAGLITLMNTILGEEPTSSVIGFGPEGNAFTNLTGRKSDKLSAQLGTFVDNLTNKQAEIKLRLGEDPTIAPLPPEDAAVIDSAFGINTTTPQQGGFNPATYYKK